jgi:Tfp pilus assembly protein PilF
MPRSKDYLAEARQLAEAGEVGAAIVVLERAVEECQDNAEVTKLLAKLNVRIDEVRAFQNWCHESLRIDPLDPEPHELLADYFEAKGRLGEAAEERRVAAALRRPVSA